MALLLFTFFVWEQRKFTELGKLYYGKSAPKWSVVEKGGTPCIRYGELYTKYSSKIDNVYSHTSIDKSKLKFSTGNELLIPRVGEEPLDFAKHTSWLSIPNVAIGEMITVLKTKENPLFLANYLRAKYVFKFARLVEGGNVSNLYFERYEDTNILIPSKNEQQNISKLILKIDKLITLQQRKLKLLRTLKSGLSFKLFNKKHLNNLSQISLDQIGQTYSGLTGKSKKDFGHGHAFYVSYLNVNQNEIGNPKQIDRIEIDKKQNLVQKNDIFFTISSETPEEVGLTSLWPVSCKSLYLNSFCFGFRINTKMFIPLYLGYLFRSKYFREKVLPLAQGISRYNLSKNNVLKIKIGQEEIAIQEKYAKVMNDLDSDILRQKKKVKELKLCKKFLLQNMFI
ncbi:restriction endonuclease subunit S [Lactobacillus gallinarum]|nr:restriction endonuclease subunit S [Lactobacillus gallinarum]